MNLYEYFEDAFQEDREKEGRLVYQHLLNVTNAGKPVKRGRIQRKGGRYIKSNQNKSTKLDKAALLF